MSRLRLNLNVIVLLLLSLSMGPGVGSVGEAAAFKATVPSMAAIYDADPQAVMKLDKEHPGIADMMASTADGSVRDFMVNKQGGKFRLIDKKQKPDAKAEVWEADAYAAWQAKGGSVPWIVGASPNGRGFNQAPPEKHEDTIKLVKPLGVK